METMARNGLQKHKSRLIDFLQSICEGVSCYGQIRIQKLPHVGRQE